MLTRVFMVATITEFEQKNSMLTMHFKGKPLPTKDAPTLESHGHFEVDYSTLPFVPEVGDQMKFEQDVDLENPSQFRQRGPMIYTKNGLTLNMYSR
jgi:hypothetical protein